MANGKNPHIVLPTGSITTISPSGTLTQAMQQFSNEEKHIKDPSPDCEANIGYSLQHVLMVMIQKITGHKTHEIFTNISSCLEQMQKDFNMDFKKKTLCREWNDKYQEWGYSYKIPKLVKKLVTYPGTDIKFYISLRTCYMSHQPRWGGQYIINKYVDKKDIKENCNYVEVSVYVPQKKIVFDEENMTKVLMEGSLLDMSDDIEEAELKDSKPRPKKKTTTDSKGGKNKGRKA